MNRTTNVDGQDAGNAVTRRTIGEPNTARLQPAPAATPATQPAPHIGIIESPQLAADRQRLLQQEQARIDQEKQAALARERELARFD